MLVRYEKNVFTTKWSSLIIKHGNLCAYDEKSLVRLAYALFLQNRHSRIFFEEKEKKNLKWNGVLGRITKSITVAILKNKISETNI